MSHDDFNFEPVRGLPEELPQGEHILWQGSPSVWRLAVEALKIRWIAGYFVALAIWQVGAASASVPFVEALAYGVPLIVAGIVTCGIILIIARAQAKSAIYTLTNKRVALRIGAALTLTLNLPYTQIGTASLETRRNGSGTLAFELIGGSRISYLMTWPHNRPWHIGYCQPAMRAIPDAAKVARIFAEAAEARVSEPRLERTSLTSMAAE